MHIWVQLSNITSVEFLVSKETGSEPQPVGFNLLTPMEYVEYAPLFCTDINKIKNTVKNKMHKWGEAPVNLMEILAKTPPANRNHVQEDKEASS